MSTIKREEQVTITLKGDEVKHFDEVLRKTAEANKRIGYNGDRLSKEEEDLVEALRKP